jgi:hypothetical protein
MLEASLTDRADGANGLGFGRIGLVLRHGVERLNIEAPAGGLLAPRGGTHGEHFLIHRRIMASSPWSGALRICDGQRQLRIPANEEYDAPITAV